MIYLRIKYMN